jgi:Sulfotransferase family
MSVERRQNVERIKIMHLMVVAFVALWFLNVRSIGSFNRTSQSLMEFQDELDNDSTSSTSVVVGSSTTTTNHNNHNNQDNDNNEQPIDAPPLILQRRHSVYSPGWDSDPIVLEQHKLLFFTTPKVGCTVFKMLFRRMMGLANWQLQQDPHWPHNPDRNGLRYLRHYPLLRANHMLTSSDWTRVVFVRDPKERVLSAYLDKVTRDTTLEGGYIQRVCCNRAPHLQPSLCSAVRQRKIPGIDGDTCSFLCFLQEIAPVCNDPHWRPQVERMEAVFWPYISFVGHFEQMAQDTRTLMERLGIWDQYGASGWGTYGNESIFASNTVDHQMAAQQKMRDYYTTPEIEALVHDRYRMDYESPVLNLTFWNDNNDKTF